MSDGATLGDILEQSIKERTNKFPTIPEQLGIETPTVDRIMSRFSSQWRTTADLCIMRAEELEAAAADLRDMAHTLTQAYTLVDEVKGAVLFEIEARNRANSLALVNPKKDD